MNLHLRADSVNQNHLHFTVFMDSQNSGQLCMDPEQALNFASLMQFCHDTLGVPKVYPDTQDSRRVRNPCTIQQRPRETQQ